MRLSETKWSSGPMVIPCVLSVSETEHAAYPIRISLKTYSEEEQKVAEKWKCWRNKKSKKKNTKFLHNKLKAHSKKENNLLCP